MSVDTGSDPSHLLVASSRLRRSYSSRCSATSLVSLARSSNRSARRAAAVPADAVTASASGLDPDISPAYAQLQVSRVAAARNVGTEDIAALVRRHTEGPDLRVFGQPRVNVLELNLDLARPDLAGVGNR